MCSRDSAVLSPRIKGDLRKRKGKEVLDEEMGPRHAESYYNITMEKDLSSRSETGGGKKKEKFLWEGFRFYACGDPNARA